MLALGALSHLAWRWGGQNISIDEFSLYINSICNDIEATLVIIFSSNKKNVITITCLIFIYISITHCISMYGVGPMD